MGINIGFTGTRDGMTAAQKCRLRSRLQEFCSEYDTVYFHEGEGLDRKRGTDSADLQAKQIAADLGCFIIEHPPEGNTPGELLARNDIIVAQSSYLIATPGTYEEITRSGTWSTVRRGRAARREGEIIWPCGCTEQKLSASLHLVP